MLNALLNTLLPGSKAASKAANISSEPTVLNRRAEDKRVTQADINRMYKRPRTFCDLLPWLEYQHEGQAFLLEDAKSYGAMYDLSPIGTEGRNDEFLGSIRDGLENALQNAFPEYDDKDGPWIVQMYGYDDYNLDDYIELLREHVWPHARGTQYTEAYLETMAAHLRGVTKSGGLFKDEGVTGGPWQGKWRRAKLFVYRRRAKSWSHPAGYDTKEELNEVCARFEQAMAPLESLGASMRRVGGKELHQWMLRWFNPNPDVLDGDTAAFYRAHAYAGDDPMAFPNNDFSESFVLNGPRTELSTQTWWFDNIPHRCLTAQRFRQSPRMGHLTGELANGKAIYALFDKLPEHTIMALTLIITPQDVLENHFNQLDRKSVGETLESQSTREDIETARQIMQSGHKLYRGNLAFYTRGETIQAIRKNAQIIESVLSNNNIALIKEADEQVGLDHYILNLPMNFDPIRDTNTQCARFLYAQHAANLSPAFGRSTGTKNPGITFFNRGGSPLSFDPLSLKDRRKNAHMLLLGPTGAGKSATLASMMGQLMAIVRPRLFIIEAGNSFGLLADYFAKMGLTVNKVQLKAGAGVSLPPFADAHLLLDKSQKEKLDIDRSIADNLKDLKDVRNTENDLPPEQPDDDDTGNGNEEQRDILGEMEIIAVLMITGGEQKEADAMNRADRKMIRNAILQAAKISYFENRQCLTEDVVKALNAISKDPEIPEGRRLRADQMSESMGLFCDGLEGEMFNRPGEAWPEADVTLIDLATYAREGYRGQLSVAYTSLLARVNNLAEKYQFDKRPLIKITDEAHIITTVPLLAAFIVKIVKMWRKLGAWYWGATQNLKDFPNEAEKLLSMIEWWVLLVMEKEEVEQVSRFRDLTLEQKHLLLSARKEPGKYTEGVVLSASIEALFRNVPPSLFLALAMTEKDEKVERRALMDQFGIDEVEAAIRVAQRLDSKRGLAA